MRSLLPAAMPAVLFAKMSKRNATVQDESLMEQNANYVRTDDLGALYKAMEPCMREMVARRWMKDNKLYWASCRQ
eukprot:872982-Pleurochrysis_carterae.AAC.3